MAPQHLAGCEDTNNPRVMMDRNTRLLTGLDKSMLLVEVGPSHNPVVPKADGWNTIVVDYADATYLREHYKDGDTSRIEEVDVIWTAGSMHEAFQDGVLGQCEAVISSHSLEHMPDAISFLQSCERVIRPGGVIKLALPDKRCCFDFFSGLSTSGDMLAAHHNGDRVHSKQTSFNQVAYSVRNNGAIGWRINDRANGLELIYPLDFAIAVFNRASATNDGDYHDFHAWKFTPCSFSLLVEELAYLGVLKLAAVEVTETIGHEFFVTLQRSANLKPDPAEFNRRRLELLKAMMRETSNQITNMI